jgi:hypothetical protein
MDKPMCKNCFFSRDYGSETAVSCRRYPPTITKVKEETQTITSNSPLVNHDWWCGEWKPRLNGKGRRR